MLHESLRRIFSVEVLLISRQLVHRFCHTRKLVSTPPGTKGPIIVAILIGLAVDNNPFRLGIVSEESEENNLVVVEYPDFGPYGSLFSSSREKAPDLPGILSVRSVT